MTPRGQVDVAKRFGFAISTRDRGPSAPREPHPTAITSTRRAWRLLVCRATWKYRTIELVGPDGRSATQTIKSRRLERTEDGPPLKLFLRQAGIVKVRGRWVKR